MQNGPVFGKGQKGPKFSPAKDSLQCVAMAATLDVQPNDEMFFEYRKYLADGEPHKHRHSMIAVKHFDTNYKCDLSRHISIYEHAHLLMLKVVRTQILRKEAATLLWKPMKRPNCLAVPKRKGFFKKRAQAGFYEAFLAP